MSPSDNRLTTLLLVIAPMTAAAPAAAQVNEPTYFISDFQLEYVDAIPFLEAIDTVAERFGNIEVELANVNGVLVSPDSAAARNMPAPSFEPLQSPDFGLPPELSSELPPLPALQPQLTVEERAIAMAGGAANFNGLPRSGQERLRRLAARSAELDREDRARAERAHEARIREARARAEQDARDRAEREREAREAAAAARSAEAAAQPTGAIRSYRIADLSAEGPYTYGASALNVITGALASSFSQSMFVAPAAFDIDPVSGADVRRRSRSLLLLRIAYDGPSIEVGRMNVAYLDGGANYPSPDEVLDGVRVNLVETADGLVAWRPGIAQTRFRLSDLSAGPVRSYTAGALQRVLDAVFRYYSNRDYMAIRALPGPAELDESGALMLERGGRTDFTIQVVPGGRLSGLRTLAVGGVVPVAERVNHPRHERIRQRSPFQPGDTSEAGVLRKSVLDDYLKMLSRYPGRRVDAAIAPGDEDLSLALDYIVTENKPLLLYGNISNTGTPETNRVRQRFGFFYNQLAGTDDTLNIEYQTASFDDTNSVQASYETRVGENDRLRWRVEGLWSEYLASEVGFAAESFSGDTLSFATELRWNFFQDREFFADLVGGVRYFDIEVNNNIIMTQGESAFLVPYFGLQFDSYAPEATTAGKIIVEFGFSEEDQSRLNNLGRLFPNEDWVTLSWDIAQSLYLEPLLNRRAWEDISSRESSTLAHEIGLRFRGQYAFDERLTPQFMEVAGGMFSVRGYPESVAVGDTVLVGSLEYRVHLPQLFGYNEQPGNDLFDSSRPFRWVPQQPFGQADWDLAFKGFIDIGQTINSSKLFFENNDYLLGAGIGFDMRYKNNFNVSVDWGFALEDLDTRVNSGSNRVHFTGSVFF